MPPETKLKHKPFSALRSVAVATSAPPPGPAPTPPPVARSPLGRVVVREEFDEAERAVITRVIGLPREQLDTLGKRWKEALGVAVVLEGRDLLVMSDDPGPVAALLRDTGADVALVRRPATASAPGPSAGRPAAAGGASEPGGTRRAQIHRGLRVAIVQKADQGSGALTEGVVQDILTSSPDHPRGIKVRLESGQVGRVHRIFAR